MPQCYPKGKGLVKRILSTLTSSSQPGYGLGGRIMITNATPITSGTQTPQVKTASTSPFQIHHPHLEGRWIWDSHHQLYWQWLKVDG